MEGFLDVAPETLNENTFKLIGSDWMLITAGPIERFNTMTASWGGLGVLWNKKVCFCVIRPHRYTYQFMERASMFTLSFFPDACHKALEIAGSKSGRDSDKMALTGLVPIETPFKNVTFSQARLVMDCRKIYFQDLVPGHFLDGTIDDNYPQKDYHRMYFGEVAKCYARA